MSLKTQLEEARVRAKAIAELAAIRQAEADAFVNQIYTAFTAQLAEAGPLQLRGNYGDSSPFPEEPSDCRTASGLRVPTPRGFAVTLTVKPRTDGEIHPVATLSVRPPDRYTEVPAATDSPLSEGSIPHILEAFWALLIPHIKT